jgi:small-conductance mechanosensitive channel
MGCIPARSLAETKVPLHICCCHYPNIASLQASPHALQFSFLYADYTSRHSFWESTIMLRKLFLLLVTICMAMARGGDIVVTQLQCLTSVLLLLIFLVLHLRVWPYRRNLVNRVDAICQLATILTFGLLMFLTLEEKARAYIAGGGNQDDPGAFAKALLWSIAAMNLSVILYLLYNAARMVLAIAEEVPGVRELKQSAAATFGSLGAGAACCGCMAAQAQ